MFTNHIYLIYISNEDRALNDLQKLILHNSTKPVTQSVDFSGIISVAHTYKDNNEKLK